MSTQTRKVLKLNAPKPDPVPDAVPDAVPDKPPNYRVMKKEAIRTLRKGRALSKDNEPYIGAMIGRTFGRLRVEERVMSDGRDSHAKYVCICSCPDQTVLEVYGTHLLTGNTRSCGCLHIESRSTRNRLSVRFRSTYVTWYSKKRFGTFAPEWAASFERFLDDVGPRPEGALLERIDPSQRYQKGNCRWRLPNGQTTAAAPAPDQNHGCQSGGGDLS